MVNVARIKAPSLPFLSRLSGLGLFVSYRTFGLGMAGVCFIFLMIFAYTFFIGPKMLSEIESGFEVKTIQLPHKKYRNQDVVDLTEESAELTSLPPAPIKGLYEIVKDKVLPIKSRNGATAFHAYKRPLSNIQLPVISIAIRDFGLSESLSEMALDNLPADISFVLSPYAKDVDDWQKRARDAGHEVWMNMPLETQTSMKSSDTGTFTLTSKANADQNLTTAHTLMSLTSGYAGLAIFSDDVLSSQPQSLIAPLDDILNRGLGILELNPKSKIPLTNYFTSTRDTPYMRVSTLAEEHVFETLELVARTHGFAIATIPPYPKLIEKLKNWNKTLGDKNIQLVPVSAISVAKKIKADPDDQTQNSETINNTAHHIDDVSKSIPKEQENHHE